MSIHVVYTKNGRLEWDKTKNRSNLRKHGYEFDVCEEFFDESMVDRIDDRQDYGETRYVAVGATGGRILSVVYTLRNGGKRIISVRGASRNERKKYLKGKTQENS